ncbi:hypothetical protein ENSA5_56840 [Enhygromyxa salina]|uniref:Uncharacterized protein n=1 Tax=Enhygromyxa salina TaxID=215803 RepID=A0A2S9XF21_9BACT|nr:hypothetical protein [Enhygromyxa salina]PRP91271.1 hypothetical protein ENSA5_56840 [Enhygromyxa salina]
MHGTTTLTLDAPPGPGPSAPPSPSSHQSPLRARDLSLALLGLFALGGAAALGTPTGPAALRLAPSVLLIDLAALALTAPALIATHQFLRLAAEPEDLAAGLGRALIHGGRVAAGLSIVVLFFSATTDLAIPTLLASLTGVGVFTSATACVELTRSEREAAGAVAPIFTLLVLAWLTLSWIIALRVGVDVGAWVLGFGRGFGA